MNVRMQLTAAKGEQHQSINEEELDNVNYHPPQGNLKWPEVRVHAEYVNQLQKTENRLQLSFQN